MLTKDQIYRYLSEMNDRLAAQNVAGEVVLCGGAVMALVYDARPSTKDVDALFAPTAVIRDIAKSMAEEHGLEEDWFNDAAKGFIDTSRMAFQDVVVFSHLRVRRPGDEEMLALKLASAREDSMDAKDALFLMELWSPKAWSVFTKSLRSIFPLRVSPLWRAFLRRRSSLATKQVEPIDGMSRGMA